MSEEVTRVLLTKQDEADITREMLDSDVCKHFIEKEPFYILLFLQVLETCFAKIRERSRIQQVADIIKGDNND